jgi:transketolase
MLASLRAMPNMYVFRPCDGNEVSGAYAAALKLQNSPSVLAFSRQGMPVNPGTSAAAVGKGAYVMDASATPPQLVIVATGSEMQLAVGAKAALMDEVRRPLRPFGLPF